MIMMLVLPYRDILSTGFAIFVPQRYPAAWIKGRTAEHCDLYVELSRPWFASMLHG